MRLVLSVLLAGLISGAALAQIPGLTKLDLNAAGNSYPLYLTPFNAANGGKICLFANEDGGKGWELYTCDGVKKPVLVLDINPATGDCVDQYSNRPTAVINDKLYFTASNGLSGAELFVFNGATMPVLLHDIVGGSYGSNPDDYTVLSGKLYFRATNPTNGYELWMFDPASGSPGRVSDIIPGPDSSVTGNIIAFNNKIYFTADSGKGNNELFQFEPFSQNITLISDIKTGPAGSFPQNLTALNNKLYFTAADNGHGRELWIFDGATLPVRITDLVSGFLDGIPSKTEPIIAAMDGKIFFNGKDSTSGNYMLFRYDATSGNVAIAPKIVATGTKDPTWLTPYNGKLYYTAYNDTTGYELWAYDTTNGAKLVMDLCPGVAGSNPSQLIAMGNDLYFKADDCNGIGIEIFRYNFTEVSVKNVKFDGDIKLYPNPAKDMINMSFLLNKQETLQVRFCDMTGKTVYNNTVNTSTPSLTISTHNWAPGTYYYTVYNAQGMRYTTGKATIE